MTFRKKMRKTMTMKDKMKTLSITVPNSTFEKFTEIQEHRNLKNQSDCLIYVIDKVYEFEKEVEQK